jgi:hypothetical protein
MKKPVSVYLIGFAGTGKYTIAKELGKLDYKIVDNHLINNPIFSLLNLDGLTPIPANAWHGIQKIREVVLTFIAQQPPSNYVFTNVLLEDDEDRAFYKWMQSETEARGSLFIPIKLYVSSREHERRVIHPERHEQFKATSISEYDIQKGLINVSHPHLHELDVTLLSASQAASAILGFVKKIQG